MFGDNEKVGVSVTASKKLPDGSPKVKLESTQVRLGYRKVDICAPIVVNNMMCLIGVVDGVLKSSSSGNRVNIPPGLHSIGGVCGAAFDYHP